MSEMKTDEMALISAHLGDALMGCYGKGRNPEFEFSRSAFGNNASSTATMAITGMI
jgi:hypothetical protein